MTDQLPAPSAVAWPRKLSISPGDEVALRKTRTSAPGRAPPPLALVVVAVEIVGAWMPSFGPGGLVAGPVGAEVDEEAFVGGAVVAADHRFVVFFAGDLDRVALAFGDRVFVDRGCRRRSCCRSSARVRKFWILIPAGCRAEDFVAEQDVVVVFDQDAVA